MKGAALRKLSRAAGAVEIRRTFLIALLLAIALGQLEQFFILLFCVTAHELAHMAVAALFGLRTRRMIFSALGETAVIDGLEDVTLVKKAVIILAGPAFNICAGLIYAAFTGEAGRFAMINYSIALFNLLPAYPLDGGRFVQLAMGEMIGALNSFKVVNKAARIVCRLFILAGFVQITLYPYNISLICVGLFILSINKKRYAFGVFEFYNSLAKGGKYRLKRASIVAVRADLQLNILVGRLRNTRFYFYAVIEDGAVLYLTDELQLIKYISVHGVSKTVGEFCLDTLCK